MRGMLSKTPASLFLPLSPLGGNVGQSGVLKQPAPARAGEVKVAEDLQHALLLPDAMSMLHVPYQPPESRGAGHSHSKSLAPPHVYPVMKQSGWHRRRRPTISLISTVAPQKREQKIIPVSPSSG